MTRYLRIALVPFLMAGCNNDEGGVTKDSSWLIPKNEVLDGGPGKDGIPALTNPLMVNAYDPSLSYLEDNDLVTVFKNKGEARAYPHKILDWHEIINDDIDDASVAITYCPLTGTSLGWNRIINGTKTTFGVSGLLYNSNLIPYDRLTNSNWSQILSLSVEGSLQSKEAEKFSLIEISWKAWKSMYPNAKVVSSNTGHSRSYGRYPYGGYKVEPFLIFPVNRQDDRIHQKERVHGIISNGKMKAFRFIRFEERAVIEETFEETEIIIVGDKVANFMVSFYSKSINDTQLEFEAVNETTEAIMKDQLGNQWNIFGEAISGPNTGEKLAPTESFMSYWFAWAAFFPETELDML